MMKTIFLHCAKCNADMSANSMAEYQEFKKKHGAHEGYMVGQ